MNYIDPHREEELREAPILRSLQKTEFFEAPADYFTRLPDRIMNRIEDMEALERAPVLMSLRKIPLFDTPDGYFDDLPSDIQQARIHSTEKKPVFEWNSLWQWLVIPKYSLSIAAVILLFFAGLWLMPLSGNTGPQINPDELVAIVDLDAYTLAQFASAGELDQISMELWESSGEELDLLLHDLELDDMNEDLFY